MNFYAATVESSQHLSFLTFEKYFAPLSDFITISSFWINMGNISGLGDYQTYAEQLRDLLLRFGFIEEAVITDSRGNRLEYSGDNLDNWSYTGHLNSDEFEIPQTVQEGDSLPYRFKLSPLHFWKKPGKSGFIMTLNFFNGNDESTIRMRLYISLDAIIETLGRLPDDRNTHFFIMTAQNEYIIFKLSEILQYLKGKNENIDIDQAVFENHSGILNRALESWPEPWEDAGIDGKKTGHIDYQYREKDWVLTFREINLGPDSFKIGTIVPLESLFLERFKLAVILIIPFIVLVSTALLALLIFDYFIIKKSEEVSETDMIMNLIKTGENSGLEFKSSLRWDYKENRLNRHLEEVILKSIAAFSNTHGGDLLIGIDDNGKILGLAPDYDSLKTPGKDYFELHLRNLVSSMYGVEYSAKNIEISFPLIHDKEICCIRIIPGSEPLYTMMTSKNGEKKEQFFIRSGNSSRRVQSIKEISNYIIGHFK